MKEGFHPPLPSYHIDNFPLYVTGISFLFE
jgi:hypothetical protein